MADRKQGLPLPWFVVRRFIATRWGCKPYEVDNAPVQEVEGELLMMKIEGEVQGMKRRWPT